MKRECRKFWFYKRTRLKRENTCRLSLTSLYIIDTDGMKTCNETTKATWLEKNLGEMLASVQISY